LRGGSSHLDKEHVVYNGEVIPIYRRPNKEIPPRREYPLPSVLFLLLSVTKTKGKAEKASVGCGHSTGVALTTCDPAGLKAQVLRMSPVSEGISSKRTGQRRG
jgi:hypothetical protein